MKYQLIVATTAHELNLQVNLLLEHGWEPYGSPFAAVGGFAQAVVIADVSAGR